MHSQPSRRTARLTAKIAFTSLCLATGTFAVSEPGWSAMLKVQGYYADLSLDLFLAQEGTSGMPTTMSAEVVNHGPDPVPRFQVWFSGDDGIDIVDDNCVDSGSGVLCTVETPLGVGEQTITPIDTRLSTSANGVLALGGFVQSDLVDPQRANDIDAKAISAALVNAVNLYPDFPPDQPIGTDGRIRFRLQNDGPGDAPRVLVYYVAANGFPIEFTCSDEFMAACEPDGSIALAVDGSVALSVALPRQYLDTDGYVSIDLFVYSEIGFDQGVSHWASAWIPATLVKSGFE
ncbi:MAG: hypothetical protein KDJ14_16995 [Xanthomonadales bacterium]|nr:hypothetical protein [Xanthomonadales bacterium]